MVNFLLLIENISKYSKNDIDQGQIFYDIHTLCSSMRETFCLSYSIRKNNNLYIYIQKEQILIKFEGKKLHYLGPDERSQALLLDKALIRITKINSSEFDKWSKSTPGIFVRKFKSDNSFIDYISPIINNKISFIIDDLDNLEKELDVFNLNAKNIRFMEDVFFIIPVFTISSDLKKMSKAFKEMKNIKIISLSKIKGVENKILYLNFLRDQQEIVN